MWVFVGDTEEITLALGIVSFLGEGAVCESLHPSHGFCKDNSMQNASIESQKVNEIYKRQEVSDTYKIHKALLHVFYM